MAMCEDVYEFMSGCIDEEQYQICINYKVWGSNLIPMKDWKVVNYLPSK